MPDNKIKTKGKAPDGPRPDAVLLPRARQALERGKALLEKDDLKAAAPVLEEAHALMTNADAGLADRLDSLVSLSSVKIQLGVFDKGEALALEAIELIKGPDVPVTLKGQANYIYGLALLRKGELTLSLKHLERALTLFETGKNKEWLAHTCRHIGNAYSQRSQYSKAIVYYNRSLRIYQELGREREVWYVRHNIAMANGTLGNFRDAITEMALVLENVKRLDDQDMLAMCHTNMGNVHIELREFDRALQHYDEGGRIARNIGNRWTDAYNTIGMVTALVEKGDLDRAQKVMDENFKSLMASKANDVMGSILRARGSLLRERGNLKKAEDDFALAERLLAQDKIQLSLVEVYREWAKTAAKAKDVRRARELFGKARAILTELKFPLLEKELDRVMKECGL